jgi:hypothetical protein
LDLYYSFSTLMIYMILSPLLLFPVLLMMSKLFKTINNQTDANLLQNDLNNLSTWSTSSMLNFNELKTCTNCQTVTRKRSPLIHEYGVNGKPIGKLDEERDLGVRVTNTLSWKSQVAANKSLAVFAALLVTLMTLTFAILYTLPLFVHISAMPLSFGPHNQLTLSDVSKGSSVVLLKSS